MLRFPRASADIEGADIATRGAPMGICLTGADCRGDHIADSSAGGRETLSLL